MPLFALPNEILTIILSFLPASDYLTIKFTCHKLNALTKTTAGHPIRDLRVDFEGNGNAYARVMVSLEGQIERAQHLTSLTCSLCGHCKKLWNGTDGFTDEDFDVTFDGRTCTRCNNAWAFTVRGVAWCHCAFCFTFKQELGVTRREIGKMLKGRLREEVMEDLDWPQDGELICFGCLKETVVESMEVLYMNDTIE